MSDLIKFPEQPRKKAVEPSDTLKLAHHLRATGFDYFGLNVFGHNRFVQVYVRGSMLRSANEGLTC